MSAANKNNKNPVPKPLPDTPLAELHRMMSSAVVSGIVLEALGTESSRAVDPTKAEMGKKKNHWALRFIIKNVITYRAGGGVKRFASVRASVEHPEGSLKCTTLTLKPMANGQLMSNSAIAHFEFALGRANLTVQNFTEVANPLLPFEYIIVARSLEPGTAGTGARGSRAGASRQELNEHPNGCRDFTAQWFIRLHDAGYVGWQATRATHPPHGNEPEEEEFHKIIGYRYSKTRLDPNPIAKARFPSTFQRKLEADVTLVWPPATGGSAGLRRVQLPYQTAPAPVQTFNKGGGSSGSSGHR